MPKLITKFKYLKPGNYKNAGNYASYIATRPGAELVNERKTYADYIATRPRAERIGKHGLFTSDDKPIVLHRVSTELKSIDNNVWTIILSLKREDAERLGFNNAKRWQNLLTSKQAEFASALHIPLNEFKWYAAFHNESHHPHIHMIAYSERHNSGYLDKRGVEKLRSALANDIFEEDLLPIFRTQTEYRDELRAYGRVKIDGLLEDEYIFSDAYSKIFESMKELSKKMKSENKGVRYYKFLSPELKNMVDQIVNLLSEDEKIAELYDKWYIEREKILYHYVDEMPPRVPLSENETFRDLQNMVVRAANHLIQPEPNEKINVMLSHHKEKKFDENVVLCVSRLIADVCEIIDTETVNMDKNKFAHTDRKLLKQIYSKKAQLGQKI